jgi:hypothetical protein
MIQGFTSSNKGSPCTLDQICRQAAHCGELGIRVQRRSMQAVAAGFDARCEAESRKKSRGWPPVAAASGQSFDRTWPNDVLLFGCPSNLADRSARQQTTASPDSSTAPIPEQPGSLGNAMPRTARRREIEILLVFSILIRGGERRQGNGVLTPRQTHDAGAACHLHARTRRLARSCRSCRWRQRLTCLRPRTPVLEWRNVPSAAVVSRPPRGRQDLRRIWCLQRTFWW